MESSSPSSGLQSTLPFNRRFVCHHKGLVNIFFVGLSLNRDYTNITVDFSMPKYVEVDLHKFKQQTPMKPQDASHLWYRPTYGAATQYADPEDNLAPLPPEGITMVRKTVGTFLYYVVAVDSTMLVARSDLTATQSNTTQQTYDHVVGFLSYAASQPTSVV